MDWHVQFIKDGKDGIALHLSPEAAIEAACRMIDDGYDVYGIGTGPLTDSIDKDQIARIYEIWARAEHPFGVNPRRASRPFGTVPRELEANPVSR